MIDILCQKLADGRNEHPDNSMFGKFLKFIVESEFVPSALEVYASMFDNAEPNIDHRVYIDYGSIRDLRCRKLLFSGLRRFPAEGAQWGIDFCSGSVGTSPASAIILGSNGVGKTSVFTALEYAATQHSSAAETRGYTGASQSIFLAHGSSKEPPEIKVYINDGSVINSPSVAAPFIPPAFFCSENDIRHFEKEEVTEQYIFHQLGWASIYHLKESLLKVKDAVESILAFIQLSEEKRKLKKGSPQYDACINRIKVTRDSAKKHLGIKSGSIPNYSKVTPKLTNELEQVISYINRLQREAFDNLFEIVSKTIPDMLEIHLEDGCSLRICKDNLSLNINIRIKDGTDIPVRRYFNTFRFKLFVTAFKIALACCVKQLEHINFPIVIDDVFDASDFMNKREIKDFIRKLILRHQQLSEMENNPLQLIFFTQDDVVGKSLYDALSGSTSQEGARYYRLFRCEEVDENDIISFDDNGTRKNFYKIFDSIL